MKAVVWGKIRQVHLLCSGKSTIRDSSSFLDRQVMKLVC